MLRGKGGGSTDAPWSRPAPPPPGRGRESLWLSVHKHECTPVHSAACAPPTARLSPNPSNLLSHTQVYVNGLKNRSPELVKKVDCICHQQLRYMMGDPKLSGRSYIVGFGTNPPTQSHHRCVSTQGGRRMCYVRTCSGCSSSADVGLLAGLAGGARRLCDGWRALVLPPAPLMHVN